MGGTERTVDQSASLETAGVSREGVGELDVFPP